jgi:hypothetical protein
VIQPLGFIDTSTFTAMYVVKHKDKLDGGILRLRDVKEDDVDATDLAILKEWKSARALLSRLRNAAAPFFDGVTPDLGRAWIEVLPPMSGTPWDIEAGDYAAAHHRTRTCLIPSPGAVTYCGLASAVLPVGMVHLVDHQLLCSDVNHGEHARVHLVVDVKIPVDEAEPET